MLAGGAVVSGNAPASIAGVVGSATLLFVATGSDSLALRLAAILPPLGQFAELLGNSFGGGKCDTGVADGSSAELVPDCVDRPVHAPSGSFDRGARSEARVAPPIWGIQR